MTLRCGRSFRERWSWSNDGTHGRYDWHTVLGLAPGERDGMALDSPADVFELQTPYSGCRRASRFQTVLVGIIALAGAVTDAPGQDEPPPRSPSCVRAHILPWIEVNDTREKSLENAVRGLKIWASVTDTAIVSTAPGHADLYRQLHERIPGLRIIPGLKTHTLLDRFDSIEGWRQVAREVTRICEASGEEELLLENETAIKSYRRGEYDIDPQRFRRAVEQIPEDVKLIWYPSIHGGQERVRQRFEVVCRIIAETHDVRFTDRSMHGPKAEKSESLKIAQISLERISSRATIPILYSYGGDRWWRIDEIPRILRSLDARDVIVYPGAKAWTTAARSITSELLKSGKSTGD